MTDRLTEIRARLDAATPGPWKSYDWDDEAYQLLRIARADDAGVCVAQAGGESARDDADFIAHAPADIAWLLAEVQWLRGNELVVQDVTKLERP